MLRNLPVVLFVLSFLNLAICKDNDATPPIEVIGNKFFYSNNGSQFLIQGIAYQQNTNDTSEKSEVKDPLADPEACKRDVKYFQESNTNTLRVYAVNHSKDHDECMKTFADAGIYIIADLAEPKTSINRDSPEWNVELFDRYKDVVDMFSNYSNVLGFFAGNEVSNNKSNTEASAFVKAAVRDTKKYIADQEYRSIPVGYSSNDDDEIRVAIADYFACGDEDDKADFFGINMYEWCGDSSYKSSGYEARTEEYKNLTIPIFFSEYGCNAKRPRKFTEIGTIFGDKMTDVWSGGLVYMYFEEDNEYGLVSVDGDDVKTLDDFSYYSKEMNDISPSLASASEASKSDSTLECPTSASTWKASSKLPPTPDKDLCDCMASSLSCVVDSDVDSEDYGDLYSYLCSEIDCDSISADAENGTYGDFSFCSDKDKLSYILNEYYKSQDEDKSACDFSGSASINKDAKTDATCASKDSSSTGSNGSLSGSNSGSSGTGDSDSDSSSDKESSAVIFGSLSVGQLIGLCTLTTSFVGGVTFLIFD